ncbi:MAG: heme exporter protein CcmD [Gammaproteobacteria bacterium]|nr:MAG: heme exporter protein CcmD [Gammaproteobacteria bacterium]
MSFEEFINMNGYGFYIWTSYAITAITFIGLVVMFKIQRNQLIKQLRKRYQQQARKKET